MTKKGISKFLQTVLQCHFDHYNGVFLPLWKKYCLLNQGLPKAQTGQIFDRFFFFLGGKLISEYSSFLQEWSHF